MDLRLTIIPLTSLLLVVQGQLDFGNGFETNYPCKGNKNIYYKYSLLQPIDQESIYFLYINGDFAAKTVVNITLILPSELSLSDPGAELTVTREEVIDVELFEKQKNLKFSLNTIDKKKPYITSVLVNNVQKCINPILETGSNVIIPNAPKISGDRKSSCGRRKVIGTELIFGGVSTKPGDWPWHAALSKTWPDSAPKYICGGTLISHSMILTAAHCVIETGKKLVPSRLYVALGKYNLYDKDETVQETQSHRIIVHEKFNQNTLENDIALVELKTEINYNEYIQPACLWTSYDIQSLPQNEIYGTVVGWGLNQNSVLSNQLEQLSMPKIDTLACIKTNELFFSQALNDNNFCAGYHNETAPRSACNGDSGGGFMVFVPDTPRDTSKNATGSWHVRGITSEAPKTLNEINCDPTQYSIFTDVSRFSEWIENNL